MDISVAIQGELRLTAASVSTLLEAITGTTQNLRELAADPRDRLVAALAQVGHVGSFDGVRLTVTPSSGASLRWTEAADHLFALLARHADAGSLIAEAGGERIHLDAGRALEPVVAADLPWLEAVEGSSGMARHTVSMPEWIRLSAAMDERQFTLIAPGVALPELEEFVASIDPPLGGVEAFVATVDDREMFLGFRRLGNDAVTAEASRSVMKRNVADSGGATELKNAIDAAGMICGVILSDDPTMDDARLGYMETLAIAMGAVVMDGMGRLVRQ